MLDALKKQVFDANIELIKQGLVIYTWGNASGIDREKGLVVIKPSGVEYSKMSITDMVVVDLYTGKVIEGQYKPSSDTATHLEIYRHFENIGGIVHTHSINAVAFAQAGLPIKPLGTTHADYFHGEVPCTRPLSENEVLDSYELNTGKVIVETLSDDGIDAMSIPAILVNGHGPFAFGSNALEAAYHAKVLETIAEMNIKTLLLNKNVLLPQYVLDKHYLRKHGDNSYYGQISSKFE